MPALHFLLIPIIILPIWILLRGKQYRDAAVFAAVSISGYSLWVCIAIGRPFIITLWIEKLIRIFYV